MMLLSCTMVDFHLFYDGVIDIQIWALLTRSQCKVSDNQVTIKARGPLVFLFFFVISSFSWQQVWACISQECYNCAKSGWKFFSRRIGLKFNTCIFNLAILLFWRGMSPCIYIWRKLWLVTRQEYISAVPEWFWSIVQFF